MNKIEFLKWVKKNMHNLNDLKTFVEIALTTSSGDGAETDRIMISAFCVHQSSSYYIPH